MASQQPPEKNETEQNPLAAQVLEQQLPDQAIEQPIPQPQKPFLQRFFTIKKILIIFGAIFLLLILVLALTRFGENQITPSRGDGEVVWWTIKEDAETLRPIVDEFERENPNIRVVIKPQSDKDYAERLTNALSGNNPPEIFEIHKSWIPMVSRQSYPSPGTVLSADEFKNRFYGIVSLELVSDRGVMAMPLYYDALAFYINQDIFTRAATVPPETWTELEGLAEEFTQRGNNNLVIQSGVAMGFTENVDYWQEILSLLMYQNGVEPADPSSDRAESVLDYYSEFKKKKVWDTRLPSSTDFFAQGNAAMYFGPTLEATNIIQQNPNLRFRTVLLPQIPKGDPADPDFSYTTYYVHGVAAGSGDRDSAWELLEYLTGSEQLQQLNDNREEKGLYPRVYPLPSMANLQNADPILGSVVALIPQARGWYLNDDRIQGDTSITDRISRVYDASLTDRQSLEDLAAGIRQILREYGIRVN